MNNPEIRRYERELRKTIHGFRLRKKITTAFQHSLAMLLEELPSPNYDDLTDAFGPPAQMAETLLHSVPNLPTPLRRWQKISLAVTICFAVAIVSVGLFTLWNVPETGVLTDAAEKPLHQAFHVDESFTPGGSDWIQPRNKSSYQITVCNTAQTRTQITVRYSKYQPPHIFEVVAGGAQSFTVNNARAGKHSISFDTPDGTLSGRIQVQVFDTVFPPSP